MSETTRAKCKDLIKSSPCFRIILLCAIELGLALTRNLDYFSNSIVSLAGRAFCKDSCEQTVEKGKLRVASIFRITAKWLQ
ncbi:hypothetical protein CFB47_30160 [Burkholderia sp. AU27893]|uniref:Uncharacterized protein n=1 Tax=Burkholderia contaminans TaxID=488447 RepID=A0A2S5E3C3_9BURK|nr:hypothetical protein CFB47_30160 [Burkholderia sp. AU27893]POZ85877.1 hypothetical protein C3743_04925 [Burkholderia contaminans]